jgi:hypothetical protein
MLTQAWIGGSIGVCFSRWHKGKAVLFLLATLVAIAVFQTIGAYLETVWAALR